MSGATRPLDGVRVLDLTRLLPGAVATMWLANFGAEVIKVEQPGVGDYARSLMSSGGDSAIFRATNRGKKSIALNLKQPRGKQSFRALAVCADIIIEGFRPGVMDRLDLGYTSLRHHNPRLIYAALTGYGQTGPYRNFAGHDANYLAMAGILDLIGPKGGAPVIPGVQIADLAGGAMQAVIGILLALAARGRTGEGQFIDISMFDGAASLAQLPLSHMAAADEIPKRGDELLSGRYACYNLYECRDGRWLVVAALESKFWANFCNAAGCPELIEMQFADEPKQGDVKMRVAGILKEHTAAEWFARLGAADCCVTPVRTLGEVLKDDHFRARPIGLIPQLAATPGIISEIVPRLGEHTREVLAGAGVSEADLDEMEREGVIG